MTKTVRLSVVGLALILVAFSFYHSLASQQAVDYPFAAYLPLISRPSDPQWLGPEGGSVVCLAISPTNPGVMYAGTWGAGVYKSADGGFTWAQVNQGLPNLLINALAVDPQNPNVVYAAPYQAQLYKSTNAGESWFLASTGIQAGAVTYSIAIDPTDSNKVYLATRGISQQVNNRTNWNGRIYRSTDAGATWLESLVDVGGKDYQDWAYSLAINPQSPNEIFAAVHEHGVYKSSNSGLHWATANQGIFREPDGMISGRTIAYNPLNPRWLFFGVWHGDGVYITDNGATSWARYNEGSAGAQVFDIEVNPQNPLNIFLATYNFMGVRRSSDIHYVWYSAGLEQDRIYTVAVNPQSPAIVFAGTNGDGLYRSTNSASSWYQSQAGITNTSVRDLLVQPNANKSLYASITNKGIYRLPAVGQAWEEFNLNLGDLVVHDLERSPNNPNLLFAATHSAGLSYVDTSLTNRWERASLTLPASVQPVYLYGPNHPFADRAALESEVEPSLRSHLPLPQVGSALLPVMDLAFAPSNGNIAYLGVYAEGAGTTAVYKSLDGGFTWSATNLNAHNIESLAVNPINPEVVYAATEVPGLVMLSTNGGSSWQASSLPPVTLYNLAISASNPNRVFAGTSDGVFTYINHVWTQVGLAGIPVTILAPDPIRPDAIWAGSNQGVRVSFNAGQDWYDPLTFLSPDTLQSITFDPLEPAFIYFGTLGRGAVKYYYP
jgi:photosystem II stability/assembly factor-like uncharacterized protein